MLGIYANIADVEKCVCHHFKGTNIFPYYTVAVNDDDILEDIHRAFEKDPIVVQEAGDVSDQWRTWLQAFADWLHDIDSHPERLFQDVVTEMLEPLSGLVVRKAGENPFFGILEDIRKEFEHTLNALASRELVIVKVIIPLEGWSRRDPREFVVYVKQRIVLLDAVFVLLDALQAMVNAWISIINGQNIFNLINIIFEKLPNLPEIWKQTVAMVFAMPQFVQTLVGAILNEPNLKQLPWQELFETLLSFERELGSRALSLTKKHINILIDVYGEHPGFKLITPFFVVLPLENLLTVVEEIDKSVKNVGHESPDNLSP
jgi:hypothetical protein